MKRNMSVKQIASSRHPMATYATLLLGALLAIGLAALGFAFSLSGNERLQVQTQNRGLSRGNIGSAWYRSSGQWLADAHTLARMAHYLFEPEFDMENKFAGLQSFNSHIFTPSEARFIGRTNEQRGWEPGTGRAISTTVL